ncbi:tetraspanin-18-like [Mya arenaria]|uniref:tetraspanin-18-like n=1 Tax=Mya arenaria TaxID=6604 RepID=UPI0022E75E4C|nr:tetraspanin-18-like [Mya arenaria]
MTHYRGKRRSDFRYLGRCGKVLMVACNVTLLLLGLGLVVLGVLMKLDTNRVNYTQIIGILNTINFYGSLTFGKVFIELPIFVISVGVAAVLLAGFGFVSTRLKKQRLLVLFSYVSLLIMVAQAICLGMLGVAKTKIETEIQPTINSTFLEYEGVDSTEATSQAWDQFFLKFECCGYDTVVSNTDNFWEFNVTTWWGLVGTLRDSDLDYVPTSCCKSATLDNYKTLSDTNCEVQLLTHYKRGCWNELYSYFTKYIYHTIRVSKATLAFEVLCIFVPFIMCVSIRQKKTIRLFEEH